MLYRRKITFFLFGITTLFCYALFISPSKNSPKISFDSLKTALLQTQETNQRYAILKEMANLYYDSKKEPEILEQLYYEAKLNKNYKEQSFALKNIIRNFNNHENRDSVVYWYEKEKELVKKMGYYDRNYFYTTQMYCHLEMWNNNIGSGISAAIDLYDAAAKNGEDYAKMISYENNAYIYQRLRQDSLALLYYTKTLQYALKDTTVRSGYLLALYASIIDSNINLQRYEDALETARKYKKEITTACKSPNNDCKIPYAQGITSANLYFLDIYCAMGDLKKADEYYQLSDISKFTSDLPWDLYIRSLHHDAAAKYFLLKGYYKKALSEANKALAEYADTTAISVLIAEIYDKMGKHRQANEIYQQLIQYKDKMNDLIALQQLHRMRKTHDKNEAILQLKETEMQLKQQQLAVMIGIGIFLLILLLIFIYYNTRLSRLQNKLKEERTQLIRAKNVLFFSKKKAEESDKLKSLFLANMSHEIRTPLNAIVGFSSLVIDNKISVEDKKTYTSMISENSQLLLNLINDVLDVSRLEAERYHFDFEPCDINDCCKKALLNVQEKVKKEVNLVFNPQKENNILVTDRLRLQQILINLLTNASKFTSKGSITIDYQLATEEKLIYFSVTDTGKGVPEEKQEIIFSRFEKLDTFTQGTGLGLSICQLIVKQLGGDIWIDKNYTQGARFIFTHSTEMKIKS